MDAKESVKLLVREWMVSRFFRADEHAEGCRIVAGELGVRYVGNWSLSLSMREVKCLCGRCERAEWHADTTPTELLAWALR